MYNYWMNEANRYLTYAPGEREFYLAMAELSEGV